MGDQFQDDGIKLMGFVFKMIFDFIAQAASRRLLLATLPNSLRAATVKERIRLLTRMALFPTSFSKPSDGDSTSVGLLSFKFRAGKESSKEVIKKLK